jgi:hypothetical protein
MACKFFALRTALILLSVLGLSSVTATAQNKEKTIYAFDLTHGTYPVSGLVADGSGNFYGTANTGGLYPIRKNPCCGTVFELSPGSNGTWSTTVIYDFKGLSDGSAPFGTMAIDKQGDLYGTNAILALGISAKVFELMKGSDGAWSEKTIYSFTNADGNPNGDLTFDSEGNLYGTTQDTSTSGGEVFELSPQSNGSWKKITVFAFTSSFPLGDPRAGVTFDKSGNLYGTAYGSNVGDGGVYELSPQSNGQWKASVLFTFEGGNGGCFPNNKLIFDSSGNLYGTTAACENLGVVFELSPGSNGAWTETALHVFPANPGKDGAYPSGNLVFDASGNLYGTTPSGGLGCNDESCGVVYRLSPQSGGSWTETVLWQFESATDGSQPQAGVMVDSAGNVFGTAKFGGSEYGYGTVFEITP